MLSSKVFLSVLLLIPCYIEATVVIDSLKAELSGVASPSQQLKISQRLFAEYIREDYDSAHLYALRAYEHSIASGDSIAAAASLMNIGTACTKLGNYECAIEKYQEAIVFNRKLGHKEGEAKCHGNLGGMFFYSKKFEASVEHMLLAQELFLEIGDSTSYYMAFANLAPGYRALARLKLAVESYRQAIEFYERRKDPSRLASLYLGLARTYCDLNQCDRAQAFNDKALRFSRSSGSKEQLASSLFYMGENFRSLDIYDSANHYLHQALAEFTDLGNQHFITLAYRLIGVNLMDQGRLEEAVIYFRKALAVARENDNAGNESAVLLPYGLTLLEMNQLDSARFFLERGYALSVPTGAPSLIISYLDQLSLVHEKLGHFKEALQYERSGDSLRSATSSEHDLTRLEKLRADLSERELELARRNEQSKSDQLAIEQAKNDLQKVVIIGVILLLVLSIVSLLWLRERSRTRWKNSLLREQERGLRAVLAATDQVRDSVARDLHDGLGQILTALEMKLHRFFKDVRRKDQPDQNLRSASELLKDAMDETRSIAYRMKPHSLEALGLSDTIEEMLRKSIDGTKLKYEFESLGVKRLDHQLEFNIYRICQELVNNTVKHSQASEMVVQLFQRDDKIILVVEDNGIGYDYEAASKTGMGLMNIKNRVESINGRLTVEAVIPSGQITKIQIPI